MRPRRALPPGGTAGVRPGAIGEILQVVRGDPVGYHVHFDCLPGRVLAVPEPALAALGDPVHA